MESASVAVGHAEEHHAHPPEANQSWVPSKETPCTPGLSSKGPYSRTMWAVVVFMGSF